MSSQESRVGSEEQHAVAPGQVDAELLLGGHEEDGAAPQLEGHLQGVVAGLPLPADHDADAGTPAGAQLEPLDTRWDLHVTSDYIRIPLDSFGA